MPAHRDTQGDAGLVAGQRGVTSDAQDFLLISFPTPQAGQAFVKKRQCVRIFTMRKALFLVRFVADRVFAEPYLRVSLPPKSHLET